MDNEFKSYKGQLPTVWRSRKGPWLLCWVDNDDSCFWECKSYDLIRRYWNDFVRSQEPNLN